MILADTSIKEYIEKGDLRVEPLDEHSIQPASIDCRLGSTFLITDEKRMDAITLNDNIIYREFKGSFITIAPRSFLLATTAEYIKLPDYLTAFVEGRSSIGRIGLFIENAGWVDPGFEGRITLELYNANSLPIELEAGRRICQLVFCKMDQPAQNPYSGKYQGQRTTTGSVIFKDRDAR